MYAERTHAPDWCAICGETMNQSHDSRAYNARYEIDLIQPSAGGTGLALRQTKHRYLERRCACGHWTRAQPGRCSDEAAWTVG